MSSDEKKNLVPENETNNVTNMDSGAKLSLPNSVPPVNLLDKRTVPLLYVQSPSVSKSTNTNNDSLSVESNIPKLTTSPTNNVAAKLVQVQSSPNTNSVFIGTLFKHNIAPKGKVAMPQKLLFTSVKGKDVSMARLILPRPTGNGQNVGSTNTPKQTCRSFNVIPCPQGATLTMASALAVKSGEGGSKILQPNIIRQRTIDGKIIPPGTIIPSSIIVPGKTSPPGLTLLKPTSSQNQSTEKGPLKVVLVDMKDKDKLSSPSSDSSNSDKLNPSELIVNGKLLSGDVKKKSEESENSEEDSIKPPPTKKSNISTHNSEHSEKSDSQDTTSSSKSEKTGTESSSVRSRSVSIESSGILEQLPSSPPQLEPIPTSPTSKAPAEATTNIPMGEPPPLISTVDNTSATPMSSVIVRDRVRKRKGSLSSVSSPSKIALVGDTYENMRPVPGADEIDPFHVIDWDEQGIGKIPDSDIKVVVNDFGMIEPMIDIDKRKDNTKEISKREEVEEIFCCVHCGCYGLISEFFNENYCSVTCRDELIAQQCAIITNINKKEELEMLENTNKDKKKNCENPSTAKKPSGNETPKSKPIKPFSLLENDVLEKLIEQDVVEVEDSSSTECDSPPKKNPTDDSKPNKIKVLPKSCKLNRKPEKPSKPTSTPPQSAVENKSKIKLRPRTGKLPHNYNISNKPNPPEDVLVQDLDVGVFLDSDKPSQDNNRKQSSFRWNSYLSQTKGVPSWVKLFSNPYPSKPNRFKVGQKLEAIDPEHQSYFCLVTVVNVKGYRLKLHFDGYPSDYDFWVNADSPNIFPSEFCSSHKIPLHPPPGVPMRTFDWNSYLVRNSAKAVQANIFENNLHNGQANLFKVDMKLEAVDRKNTYLVCVATVAAVMENRILIHFDSWGDLYDYWVDVSSPYIRPVGWCQKNNHDLTPPNGIKPENFSWKRYLRETKSIAAPDKAFTLRPPIEFKKGMKIEAVDKRAPHLIRVATIAEVLPYQVKITFDGFPPHFGYWVDDDCPDIHPVGWSSRAGHPLEPPPSAEDLEDAECPTPGCIGQGYLHGTKQDTHTEVKNCPYATEHLGKDTALTDRLKWSSKSKRNGEEANLSDDSDEESDEDIENIRWSWIKVQQQSKKNCKRIKETEPTTDGNTGDSVSDPEEIKKIFGPPSPIKLVDITDAESIVEIKKENTDTVSSQLVSEIQNFDEDAPKAIDEVKKEPDLETIKVKDEPMDTCELTNDVSTSKNQPESDQKPVICIKKENKENNLKENNIPEVEENQKDQNLSEIEKPPVPSPKECKKSEKETLTPSPVSEKLDPVKEEITSEKCPEEDKNKLEEKNALYWSIHQVSQFTRPLISCSNDCFLKEGIDGLGFLMLNKNDLLDYLGLSDNDAERVFSKISMLRQKVV